MCFLSVHLKCRVTTVINQRILAKLLLSIVAEVVTKPLICAVPLTSHIYWLRSRWPCPAWMSKNTSMMEKVEKEAEKAVKNEVKNGGKQEVEQERK